MHARDRYAFLIPARGTPRPERTAGWIMIGYLTHTAGAPCPTLVMDARVLPRSRSALLGALSGVRKRLALSGGDHVLKLALIEPSPDPDADLDYRFVQALPDRLDHFDLRGSCGHSILGAALASVDYGMVPKPAVGQQIRVRVLNNSDRVICELEQHSPSAASFTVRFRYEPPRPAPQLLLEGKARTVLDVDGEQVAVSLVSVGNPYVFVAGASVAAPGGEELFAGGPEMLGRLLRIRAVAAERLGWSPAGAFPKVAAVVPAGSAGGVAVRAVTVPGWHPTLALTGSVCLAAATKVAHSIPWLAARAGGEPGDSVELQTPGERWPVAVTTVSRGGYLQLTEITIGHRQVVSYGSLRLITKRGRQRSADGPVQPSPARPLTPAHLQSEEVA